MFSISKSQEIADLQAKVEALTTENATQAASISAGNATIATITAERDVALSALQSEKDKLAAAEQLIAEANTKITTLESGMTEKIESEVISRLASAGTEPITRAPEQKGDAPESKKNLAGLTGIEKARAALKARADAIASAQKN